MSVVVTPGEIFTLTGSGFGLDVAIEVGGFAVAAEDTTRVSESEVRFKMPVLLTAGLHDLKITNVLANVSWTEVDAVEVEECDLELLELILRGDIGGHSHSFAQLIFVDDNGAEVDISEDIETMDTVQRRDDRRTDLALLMPPAATLDATLFNVDKRFTPRAGGTFDGKLALGRVLKAKIGYMVNGTPCPFSQGEYLLDDPDFQVAPNAKVTITARDKLSIALDRKISMRSFVGRADEYILEVLEKLGITAAETIFPQTVMAFTVTPVFTNKLAIEILSDVLTRLQTEGSFRIIQIDDKIRLVEVPRTGIANIVFHFKRDMKAPYSRKERANQAKSVITVSKLSPSVFNTDVPLVNFSGDGTDFTGSPPRKSLSYGLAGGVDAVHAEWRKGATDTLPIKETSRDTQGIIFGPQNAADAGNPGLIWSVAVRGDSLTGSQVVAEAGPGIDQGGTGLGMKDADGNELNMITLRRGKTREEINGFITNNSEAQALANELQITFGPPVRELTMNLNFANPTLRINDLFRVVEKYSEDLSLFHMGEIRHSYRAKPVSLRSKIIGAFANIIEIPQAYDKGFQYNQGRIYDERFGVGNKEDEDLSFRGAVVTSTRP